MRGHIITIVFILLMFPVFNVYSQGEDVGGGNVGGGNGGSRCEAVQASLDKANEDLNKAYDDIENLKIIIKNYEDGEGGGGGGGDGDEDGGDGGEDCSKWKAKYNACVIERDRWKNKYYTANRELTSVKNTLKITEDKLLIAENELSKIKKELADAKTRLSNLKEQLDEAQKETRRYKQRLSETEQALKDTTELLNWYRAQELLMNSLVINSIHSNSNNRNINKKNKYYKADNVEIILDTKFLEDGTIIECIVKRRNEIWHTQKKSTSNGTFYYLWDRSNDTGNANSYPKSRYSVILKIPNKDYPKNGKDIEIEITPSSNSFKLKKKRR